MPFGAMHSHARINPPYMFGASFRHSVATSHLSNLFDASTKFPQGIFAGYTRHLGNFDECIGIEAQTVYEERKFKGKHCMVTLTLNNSGETTKNVSLRVDNYLEL
uniref:Nose resistant-to-fluoxetine protein N-terminal domain-containing protein n=1 Tax=Timema poppense TaxID=170557 RepID=A0A7R9HHL2_TIMPO|nr:unnamed protein product [Timema poppensis]